MLNYYVSFKNLLILPLYLSCSANLRIILEELPTGVHRVWSIEGWADLGLKHNSFNASWILSWDVLEKTFVIFHYLAGSSVKLLDCSTEGETNNLTFPSLVISLTVTIKANSITFPNSVILWIKSLLSLVVFALLLINAVNFEFSYSRTGLS